MAQIEIKHLEGNTYYIPCPTNIGIYVKDGEVTLIDTGIDKDIAKKILKCIEEKGWRLKNIFNTHSHADHIGGNAYLVETTGCFVIAPKGEAAYIENTLIEPSFLYGGFPHKVLRNKFLMAKPCPVKRVLEAEGYLPDSDLQGISLPGHCMDMMGIRTPEGIVFTADSLIPQNIVAKYHLFYLWDIKAHLETLEKMKSLEATLFVPSHGETIKDLSDIIAVNREKVVEIIQRILNLCSEPISTEGIMESLCRSYEIGLNTTQYVLLSNTIRSYLSYLYNEGLIEASYEAYKMTWKLS